MIADIEAGNVNCVIVKDLSRFGRDYIDTGKYLERYFPDHNVRFISITDNIDSISQPYDMLLPIKNIFNEQYARDISKKVHASIQTKQKAGEFIGAFASYGYKKSPSDKNKLIIDTYAAGIVRKIFQLYANGYGKIRIANILNKQDIACPSEYKKMNGENYRNSNRLDSTSYWTYSTINRILQNEIYTGNMVQGKKSRHIGGRPKTNSQEDWIVVPNTHEAIIDGTTWQKTQDLLKRRTRNLDLNANVSIFAGFLKCGDCGRALVKKTRTSKQNSTIHYYCGTYVRSGKQYCTPHAIPHSVLEKIILNDLNIIIQNIGILQNMILQNQTETVTRNQAAETEKKRLSAELEKVRKLKQAVYEDYHEELISKEEFVTYQKDYRKKEMFLSKQLESAEKQQNKEYTLDVSGLPWIKHLLNSQSIETLDRDTVTEMIQEIKIFENHKIKITYHFSNELEHLFPTIG